jgi:hypothetical protein
MIDKKDGGKIEGISRKAWKSAEALSGKLNLLGPSPLNEFAESVGIRRLRLARLLSDAGLAQLDPDYEIVINTDGPARIGDVGRLISLEDDEWSKLSPPLRFTVAHEISHLLFLNAAGGDRQAAAFTKKENEPAVEQGCSRLARVLLLPQAVLARELGSRLFEVNHVRELSRRFRVSLEVLIRRLHLSDIKLATEGMDGLLAVASGGTGDLRVRFCHILGTYAVSRFEQALDTGEEQARRSEYRRLADCYRETRWRLNERRVNEIHRDMEGILRNGENSRRAIEVTWAGSQMIPCEVSSCALNDAGSAFLFSLRVAGSVYKLGEKPLL